MYAIYKGKKYKCGYTRNQLELYVDDFEDGFEKDVFGFIKKVDRSELERLYIEEPRFLYKGCEFRYRDEKDGKILIELPYDDEDEEIIRLSYDEYGKWVPLSEGKKVIWTEEK